MYVARGILFYVLYALGIMVFGLLGITLGRWLRYPHAYYLMSRFNWYALQLARWVCGIRYEVVGLENVPAEPCVVVSNHESAWETYMTGLFFRPQATVLKQELMRIPFFGWALRPIRPIALDRSKPTSALKQLLKEGAQRLKQGDWVVVFPEGTRVRPGQTGKYNKGAAMLAVRAGVPVLPLAHNAGQCWPPGQIAKYPGRIRVMIGPVIQTQGRETDAVHAEIEQWIRTTSASLRF